MNTAGPKTKMVGWYDPGQLTRTAGAVVVSTLFGRHSDNRLIEALFDTSQGAGPVTWDYSAERELWLDYVADVGDGWSSTYTVAYYLGMPTLGLKNTDGSEITTQRGKVLVFGGDEVYPAASRSEYKRRTILPYSWALDHPGSVCPDIYAIPGNHDWYDSLESFTRLFIAKSSIGGLPAHQKRSYFSIKLPHGWWLLAADVQLGHYIDGPQVKYFQEVAKVIGPDDRVIVCTAEPTWIYDHVYKEMDPTSDDANLDFLVNDILKGKQVKVFLAGDLHHYRRHEAADHTQKIIAGGGGAFLHPTHGWDVKTIVSTTATGTQSFAHRASWPSPETSWRLCLRNLLFPIQNWKFGIAPALAYLLTAWAVLAPIGDRGLSEFSMVVYITLRTTLNTSFGTFWVILVFLGFWLFTDTHSVRFRYIAGTVHGLVHVAAVFFIGWWASYVVVQRGFEFTSISQLVLSGALIFLLGWIIGSVILGLYLLISLNVFGRHTNEAFSSLAIADWKNFLRMKIAVDGSLTIYPIGIRRVATKWAERPSPGQGLRFTPSDPAATGPELIERPIVIP